MEVQKYFLYPGYIFFSEDHYQIETILGSCVSVCLWDKVKKFGGMNHYIYASYREDEKKSISGSIAIPHLINIMLKHGSQIKNMEAYVVGGAKNSHLQPTVGNENIMLAKKILEEKNIKIAQLDQGGEKGRKIIFDNYTGKLMIHFVKTI